MNKGGPICFCIEGAQPDSLALKLDRLKFNEVASSDLLSVSQVFPLAQSQALTQGLVGKGAALSFIEHLFKVPRIDQLLGLFPACQSLAGRWCGSVVGGNGTCLIKMQILILWV